MKDIKVFELSSEKLLEVAKEIRDIDRAEKFTTFKRSRLLNQLMGEVGDKNPYDVYERVKIMVKAQVFDRFVNERIN